MGPVVWDCQPGRSPLQFGEKVVHLAAAADSFGANDFPQLLHLLALIIDEQFGVIDDVDEQDMPNLKTEIVVEFWRHHVSLARGSSGDDYYFVSFGACD
jgi:hypothetical protein